jgi:hypothetical protein
MVGPYPGGCDIEQRADEEPYGLGAQVEPLLPDRFVHPLALARELRAVDAAGPADQRLQACPIALLEEADLP